MTFARRISIPAIAGILTLSSLLVFAQDASRPVFRVKVDMVVLGFTVTDSKGRYINGLKPKDFRIMEDTIVQKLRGGRASWLADLRRRAIAPRRVRGR